MATYNEIIKLLSNYAVANNAINSFGNGDMSELVETFGQDDAEYSKMWAEDLPNTTAQGEEVFKFRIYMIDQVATLKEKTETTKGEDNVNEVKSNMRQNCIDLLSYLIQQTNYSEITSDKNVVLTSFVDRFNDKLTGWYFDLNIRQALRFSACIIPMDGIPPPPSSTCDDGTVTIKDSNGNTLYIKTVASGGIADQSIADGTNTLNGGAISGILAEGTKAITLVDDLGAPVMPTILVDTKTNLDLEVSAGVSGIAYVRDGWIQNEGATSNITGDVRDYLDTTQIFTYTASGITPLLDPTDTTKLLTLNFWSNLNRVTNDKGNQNYTDVGGGLTSDGATAGYAVDNFTGKGMLLSALHAGTQNWNNSVITAKAFTLSAFDGSTYGSTDYGQFHMLTYQDVHTTLIGTGAFSHIFSGIKTWSDSAHYIMNSIGGSSIMIWRENTVYFASTNFTGLNPASVSSSVDLLVCRNHF